MKARKKTGVIEVQQYLKNEVQGWPPFVKFQPSDGQLTVWNKPQNTWVGVNDGDYIRIDNPEDIYPIAADYFAQNYEPIEESVPVRA